MKKLLLWPFIGILVISMALVGIGCSKEEVVEKAVGEEAVGEEAVEDETVVDEAVPAEEETTDFTGQSIEVFLITDNTLDILGPATEEFEELYGVTVDYNEVSWDIFNTRGLEILATDEPMDVMTTMRSWWAEFPDKFLPLNDLLPEMINDMVPELLNYGVVAGDVLSVMSLPSYRAMFYNTEVFEAAGLDIPVEGVSWDDFKVMLKALNDSNGQYNFIDTFGQEGIQVTWAVLLKGAGINFYDIVGDEVIFNIDSPENIATVKFMKSLLDEDLIDPGSLSATDHEVTERYSSGEIGMMYEWDGFIPWLDQEVMAKSVFGVAPSIELGMGGNMHGHFGYSIPAASDNPELAAEYVKFISSREITKEKSMKYSMFPIYKDQANDSEIMGAVRTFDAISPTLDNVAPQFAPIKGNNEFRAEVGIILHEVFLGEKTVEEAMVELQAFADALERVPNVEDYFIE